MTRQFNRLEGLIDHYTVVTSHVMIVGAGSGGQQLAKTLASLGLGNLTLVDGDIVDEPNIATTDMTLRDVGRFKVDVAKEAVMSINPATQVTTFACGDADLSEEALQALWASVDLVLQLTDSPAAAYRINAMGLATGTPVINAGTHAGSRAFEIIALFPECAHVLGCYACIAHDRYRHFKVHGAGTPTSFQASRLGAHMRNAVLEYATVGLLHHMARSPLEIADWGKALQAHPAWIGRTSPTAFSAPGSLFGDVASDLHFGVRAINPRLPDGYCCPECGRSALASAQPAEEVAMGN